MIWLCIRRPIATTMAFAALCLLGTAAFVRLRLDLYPRIEVPTLTVLTPYQGAAPDLIENLVTAPVEQSLSAVAGVRTLRSRSEAGLSIVTLELEWGSDLNQSSMQARQKLDLARARLPEDAGRSLILQFDAAEEPILTIVAHPSGLDFRLLRDYIETNVRPQLERTPGVAAVGVFGGLRREIQVEVDPELASTQQVPLSQVAEALAGANFSFPVGNVRQGDQELVVRVEHEFPDVNAIGNTVVSVGQSGEPLTLNRLGSIVDGYQDQRGAALYNGNESVLITIRQSAGTNTVDLAERVRERLERINTQESRRFELRIVRDQSRYIVESIDAVRNAGLLGALMAGLVLFAFLGDVRTACIALLAIPVSILGTMLLMYAFEVTLNLMSLGGLAVGIGMMVDNAIVVLEAIYAQFEGGEKNAQQAALKGTRSVHASVTASTLTSLVVFVPVLFVPGIAGAVFRDLALTICFALGMSLSTSLTLVPTIAARIGPRAGRGGGFAGLLEWSEGRIVEVLRRALKTPRIAIAVLAGLSLFGAVLLSILDRRLFPAVDRGEVLARIELPAGVLIKDATAFHRRLQQDLIRRGLVSHAVARLGYEPDDFVGRARQTARVFTSRSFFRVHGDAGNSETLKNQIVMALASAGLADAQVVLRGDPIEELLGLSGDDFSVEVSAVDRASGRRWADTLAEDPALSSAFGKIRSTSRAHDPEFRLQLDGLRVASFGLDPQSVTRSLSEALAGRVATVFRQGDRRTDIRVRSRGAAGARPEDLRRVYLTLNDGAQVRAGGLMNGAHARGYTTLLRENQRRVERLRFLEPVSDVDPSTAINSRLAYYAAPAARDGVRMRLRGNSDQLNDSLAALAIAFALSCVLVYQVLGAQFESLLHPFTLALSVPVMLFGAALPLALLGHQLSIPVAMGLVLLIGIVINASIMLYEAIVARAVKPAALSAHELEEVLVAAVRERVRPIFLTTMTTILALLPLGLGWGAGADVQAPLAATVIGGLAFGAFAAPIAFPLLYFVAESLRRPGKAP